ncbi:MAG TPA: RNA polymerase sigma factor [Vicinamibacterales bacterium]|nr:RNA polymerase sigma factor [Vicinamibacterales bacterium]
MDMPNLVVEPAASPVLALSDSDIVRRVRAGEHALFEVLMRRHNQRVYRTARAVVKDETEVEDVMQQAYVNAFTHLRQFEDRSEFSTWMTRITLNEAFARRKKRQRAAALAPRAGDESGALMETIESTQPDPERQAYAQELRRVLEQAVDELPDNYRVVFMLRDVEGLSTSETGAGLGIGEEAVKTRLHRARAMIRRSVSARIGAVSAEAFQFQAPRCDRVVAKVLESIQAGSSADPT